MKFKLITAALALSATTVMANDIKAPKVTTKKVTKTVNKANAAAAKTTTAAKTTLNKTKVTEIQKALNKHGVKVPVDGNWNAATSNAIKSFQTKNSLQVTGQADQPTLAKLGVAQ